VKHLKGKKGVFFYEGDTANSPDEVPLCKPMQHGEKTRRAGSYHDARNLVTDCPY